MRRASLLLLLRRAPSAAACLAAAARRCLRLRCLLLNDCSRAVLAATCSSITFLTGSAGSEVWLDILLTSTISSGVDAFIFFRFASRATSWLASTHAGRKLSGSIDVTVMWLVRRQISSSGSGRISPIAAPTACW